MRAKDCVATAPTPRRAPGTTAPTARNLLATAMPWASPWRATIEKVIGGRSGVDVRCEGADAPQVAVLLVVVEAVADDELVGDVEADVLHRDVDLDDVGLAQQRADLDRGGAARLEVGLDPRERQAGVDDVLDDEHVAAADVGVEVLEDADDAGGLRAGAVGRDRHPVHRRGAGEGTHEVGHDDDGTLEDTDEEELLALVVLPDVGGELGEAGLDLLLGEQDLGQVISHVLVVHEGSSMCCGAGSCGRDPFNRTRRVADSQALAVSRSGLKTIAPAVRATAMPPGTWSGPCPCHDVSR